MKLEQIKEVMRGLQNVAGRVEVRFEVKAGTILRLTYEVHREYGVILQEEDSAIILKMVKGSLLLQMGDIELYFKEA